MLVAASKYWLRDKPLPDDSVIELDRQSIGRKNRPQLPGVCPNVSRPVDSCSRQYSRITHEIEVPAVLRHDREPGAAASADALILAREICILR